MIQIPTNSNSDGYQPRTKPFYKFPQYATLSLILTPIIAYILAFYGYIPFDPLYAALSEFAFAIVYVGYRGYYWTQYRKDERKQLKETQEEDTFE
ncbi:MAG: hypothetical protein P1Q69_18060 [Candidatus Thorarchaeota archaeon]|nr:hypothetical protein [Candidatus Thorarchaeota archaeon]